MRTHDCTRSGDVRVLALPASPLPGFPSFHHDNAEEFVI